jgi:hypothetical protein
MNIQFDDNITQPQAQGIILLLTALYPELNNLAPTSQPVSYPVPTTEAQAIFGVAIPTQATPNDAPTQPTPSAGPTPINEPSTRKRRTKAEIAAATGAADADEAQAKAQAALDAGTSVAEATKAQPTADPQTEPTPTPATSPTPITKEELTSLANGFIQRHSMEDAFAAINAFGCSRINEAMALPPEKLAALAEKLRG